MDVFKLITENGSESHRNDDDFADRMSYKYTAFVLFMFTLFVVTNPFVAGHIQCWCPAHFSPMWVEYTNQYCWARGTYDLPFSKRVPKQDEQEHRHYINYYQWVPLVLITMAGLACLPIYIWRAWNTQFGIDVNNVMECSEKFTQRLHNDKVKRDDYFEYVLRSFDSFLMYGKSQYKFKMTALYFVVKFLFLAITVGFLIFLNMFVGDNYLHYGPSVVQTLANRSEWIELNRFPRLTMCDFNVRRLANVQRYTVQCVLTSNLYYEKIFFFLWFWLVGVLLLHVYFLAVWLLNMLIGCLKKAKIRSYLQDEKPYKSDTLNDCLKDKPDIFTKENIDRFIEDFINEYLKMDGCFLLFLIEYNTDKPTVDEIVKKLWDFFLRRTYLNDKILRHKDSTIKVPANIKNNGRWKEEIVENEDDGVKKPLVAPTAPTEL